MTQPFPQPRMIAKLRRLCDRDPDLQAAMLYGSFPLDEADSYSDIDCMLYFKEMRFAHIDPRAWVSQLGPLLLFYRNEFGNWTAVFENLVRAEFHFEPHSKVQDLALHKGRIWFPSVEAALLVDKSGELTRQLQELTGQPPFHRTLEELQYQTHSFCNWVLFGANVFARGEYARALEILQLLYGSLLRLARLQEASMDHWINPTRQLENELSQTAYRNFQACTASLEPADLSRAYRNSWAWGRSLVEALYSRFGEAYPGETCPNELLDMLQPALLQRLAY